MSEEVFISIIIPAYNEAGAIADTVSRILALKLPDSELLVVDDGSSDETAARAEEAGARVVRHPYNIGNGAAVKTGIRSARGEVLVFMDGDGQHDPNDIPRFLKHIPRYHMVVGARQKGSETHWHRNIANFFYNKFSSFIASFPVEDLTSGFRAMRKADARRFCDLFPNGFSYPTTSTLAFLRSGRTVKYIPIETKFRVGKSKIKLVHDGLNFLLIIVKIAMSFSPLRVFVPVSLSLFTIGVLRYIYTYLAFERFTNMSHLLINSSIIIFLLGLIAEQIVSLRLEKGERLFTLQDDDLYKRLNDLEVSHEERSD